MQKKLSKKSVYSEFDYKTKKRNVKKIQSEKDKSLLNKGLDKMILRKRSVSPFCEKKNPLKPLGRAKKTLKSSKLSKKSDTNKNIIDEKSLKRAKLLKSTNEKKSKENN